MRRGDDRKVAQAYIQLGSNASQWTTKKKEPSSLSTFSLKLTKVASDRTCRRAIFTARRLAVAVLQFVLGPGFKN